MKKLEEYVLEIEKNKVQITNIEKSLKESKAGLQSSEEEKLRIGIQIQ